MFDQALRYFLKVSISCLAILFGFSATTGRGFGGMLGGMVFRGFLSATNSEIAHHRHLLAEGFYQESASFLVSLFSGPTSPLGLLIPTALIIALIAHVRRKRYPLQKLTWPSSFGRTLSTRTNAIWRATCCLYSGWFNLWTGLAFSLLTVALIVTTHSQRQLLILFVAFLIPALLYLSWYSEDFLSGTSFGDSFTYTIVLVLFTTSFLTVPHVYGRHFFAPELQVAESDDPRLRKEIGIVLVFDDQHNILGLVQQRETRGARVLLYKVKEGEWKVREQCRDIVSGKRERCSLNLRTLAESVRPSVQQRSSSALENDLGAFAQ